MKHPDWYVSEDDVRAARAAASARFNEIQAKNRANREAGIRDFPIRDWEELSPMRAGLEAFRDILQKRATRL